MNITITEEQIRKAAEDLHWGDFENYSSEQITEAFQIWLQDHIESILEEADWWVHQHDLKVFRKALFKSDKAA